MQNIYSFTPVTKKNKSITFPDLFNFESKDNKRKPLLEPKDGKRKAHFESKDSKRKARLEIKDKIKAHLEIKDKR